MRAAADQMDRATRASRRAGMGSGAGGFTGGREREAGNGPFGGGPLMPMPYGEQRWRNPYDTRPAGAPSMLGYEPYIYDRGEIIPPDRSGGPGGLPAPYGPTIDGTASQPGYRQYGPTGRRSAAAAGRAAAVLPHRAPVVRRMKTARLAATAAVSPVKVCTPITASPRGSPRLRAASF